MQEQRVSIKLTAVSTSVGDFTSRLDGWEGEVKKVEEIREQIREQMRVLVRRFNRHLDNSLVATVTLEDGTELKIPIEVNLVGTYNPGITELSFRAALGGEVPIKFGSMLHETLHKAACGKTSHGTRSITTLRSLGLMESWNTSTTSDGQLVLYQLNELGPPENKRGRILVARELLDVAWGDASATRAYLIEHEFIERYPPTARYELSNKGIQWLEENAHRIYSYKLPPKFNIVGLVAFMSKEQLAAPLASEDSLIRNAARDRMRQLGEEVEENEPVTLQLDVDIPKLWQELFGPAINEGLVGHEETES